jgi:endonuclease/exonuclease/phosphatase family metal-dependent hydrolase
MLQGSRSVVAKMFVCIFALSISSLSWGQLESLGSKAKPASSLSIMSYNVENLFDTQKDPGKDDYEYLPRSTKNDPEVIAFCEKQPDFRKKNCLENDWNESVLHEKMKRLADTILQINGKGADILILVEVENIRVLEQLNEEHLNAAGYSTVVLIEGQDRRGIDIAVLSRLPLAEQATLHEIKFSKNKKDENARTPKTRGILEVPLKTSTGQIIRVFGLHFPSQSNPHQQRADAVLTLKNLLKAVPSQDAFVAGGDFNITPDEDAKTGLFKDSLGQSFSVSHLVGCQTCKGTYNHKGQWNFLDALIFSKQKISGAWNLDPQTIKVPMSGRYQLDMLGNPARFDSQDKVGVSDHLPIYGEFTLAK